jgi:phytanoyl-CoA hydroxylase
MLTQAQVDEYQREGFLVVHNLLTPERADWFVAYEATQDPEWRNRLDNHVRDPEWTAIVKHQPMVSIAGQLLGAAPMIVQSMYLEKFPAAEGKGTAPHQDAHYLPNEPNTLMACWLAMSDTDGENGGLVVLPRSHTGGLLETHKATNLKDHQVWESEHLMRDRGGREWKQVFYSFEIDTLDRDKLVHLQVPKGSGVLFSGMTIHGSFGNRSRDRVRRAFATHFVAKGTWVLRADVQQLVPAE